MVSSLETIVYLNREEAINKISEICRKFGIDRIVIGMPLGNDNSEDVVRSFALELNKTVVLPIEYEDESLTSKEAERILKEKKIDPRSENYKQEVDRLSAKMILEQYLNR
jgi:putative Holliday junction resolvase